MQIQQMLDTAKLFGEIKFEGEINLELPKSTSFYVGKNFSKSLVNITKPNITLDFSEAIVRVQLTDPLDTDDRFGAECRIIDDDNWRGIRNDDADLHDV